MADPKEVSGTTAPSSAPVRREDPLRQTMAFGQRAPVIPKGPMDKPVANPASSASALEEATVGFGQAPPGRMPKPAAPFPKANDHGEEHTIGFEEASKKQRPGNSTVAFAATPSARPAPSDADEDPLSSTMVFGVREAAVARSNAAPSSAGNASVAGRSITQPPPPDKPSSVGNVHAGHDTVGYEATMMQTPAQRDAMVKAAQQSQPKSSDSQRLAALERKSPSTTLGYGDSELVAKEIAAAKAKLGIVDAAKTVPAATEISAAVTAPAQLDHDSQALAATMMSQHSASDRMGAASLASGTIAASNARTTVLPRVEASGSSARMVMDGRPRYEQLRPLGMGGVGEVALVQDHDIDRAVAVKKLRAEQNTAPALLRFADEVRTIGQLEHPNIVPVHDVGIDENGSHFFVMKYVEGETLEDVIEKLAKGDKTYLDKWTFEYRLEVFLGILHAIHYAHARGIVHRDIKPSNVMVGRFGEVMVMDWGLAKKVRNTGVNAAVSLQPATESTQEPAGTTERDRIFKTRHGSLLGTPAYMSPEQARGQTDAIDERSDVYSLCVVLHELLTLRHYLHDKNTVAEVLTGVVEKSFGNLDAINESLRSQAPIEMLYLTVRGLEKDPTKRIQSVSQLVSELESIRAGKNVVQCPISLMKRSGNEYMHFMNRHPLLTAFITLALVSLSLMQITSIVMRLVS